MIGLVMGITVAAIMLIVVFSVFPMIMEPMLGVSCPAITGDTNGNYVQDSGENWTGDPEANTWSVSCNNVKAQTAVVPIVAVIAVIIGSIVFVSRMFSDDSFSGSNDYNEEKPVLPKGHTMNKPSTTITKPIKKKSFGQKMRWFIT